MEILGLGLTLLVGIFILIGSLIIVFSKNNEGIISFSLSLAFSVMVGLILVELIPEAKEHLNKNFLVIIFTLIGILILKLLDYFIPHHDHSTNKENLYHIGIVASVALVIHNVIEGMAIYGVTCTDIHLGILMSMGVGLHNIPMGMVITSTLLQSNKKISIILPVLILSTLVGGLIMLLLEPLINEFILGAFLSITLGMLFYISMFELLPKIYKKIKNKPTILGIILGIIVIILTLSFHYH